MKKMKMMVSNNVTVVEHVTYTYSCRNCDKKGTSSSIRSAVSPKALKEALFRARL
ncbi:MAG: hypothetical protein RSA51_06990 [Niameybacter sp.]